MDDKGTGFSSSGEGPQGFLICSFRGRGRHPRQASVERVYRAAGVEAPSGFTEQRQLRQAIQGAAPQAQAPRGPPLLLQTSRYPRLRGGWKGGRSRSCPHPGTSPCHRPRPIHPPPFLLSSHTATCSPPLGASHLQPGSGPSQEPLEEYDRSSDAWGGGQLAGASHPSQQPTP